MEDPLTFGQMHLNYLPLKINDIKKVDVISFTFQCEISDQTFIFKKNYFDI
jgi:hypothetical protein